MRRLIPIVMTAALFLLAAGAWADVTGYGILQSFGNGQLFIRLSDQSTGNWTYDKNTHITGGMQATDWVYVDVEPSGHVKTLRVEEVAAQRGGVVKQVKGNVLMVKSGSAEENWNVTPITILQGIEAGQFQPGDEIAARLYKNHNLAEVRLIKRGMKA